MSYSSEVLADSPLCYYRLNEVSGTVAGDGSGNGHNGAYSGTLTLGVPGLLTSDGDRAAQWGASYVGATHAAWMDVTSFTAEAWVKLASVRGTQTITSRYTTTGGSPFTFRLDGNKAALYVFGSGTYSQATSTTSLVTGTIYHLVATYDGTNQRVYVNGSLEATVAHAMTNANANEPLVVGAATGPGEFLASGTVVDEFAFYGSALSGTRITAHYNAGVAAPPVVSRMELLPARRRQAPQQASRL